jgi:hypothetical protein
MKTETKEILKLDPTSDRYRICPYCKKAHMVNHLGRDYCCDAHADKHYNEKRRLKKQAEKIIAESQIDAKDEISDVTPTNNLFLRNEVLEKNIALLGSLNINPVSGNIFKIPYLEAHGCDFNYYSLLLKNENVPDGYTSNSILIKNFKITRIEQDKVKIIKTI